MYRFCNTIKKRGLFIAIEGLDKSGKSTQAKLLAKYLNAEKLAFPDRKTELGNLISQYLKGTQEMKDEVIHLLFSANRWEKSQFIIDKLLKGRDIVSDRYAYSGYAFSVAKGMQPQWCKSSDSGLPKPDVTIYLKASVTELSKRGDFGAERYENQLFQNKVGLVFDQLANQEQFYIVDAMRSQEDIQNEIRKLIKLEQITEIKKLWEPTN